MRYWQGTLLMLRTSRSAFALFLARTTADTTSQLLMKLLSSYQAMAHN
jgi:hypothetical protein